MTDIDDAIDDVRDAAVDLLNSEGRSTAHVVAGIALTVGFALLAHTIASGALKPKRNLKQMRGRDLPITEKPRGAFSLVLGFAMVWHMWVLAIIGLVGMIATFIYRTFDKDVDYWVPAAEVERIENEHRKHLEAQGLVKTEVKA